MNICVYGISLNEERNVARFMDSTLDADGVYISDTGSTDDTVDMLRRRGANVQRISVVPWRFDTARNISLDYVPEDADVCVCLDLDEVLVPGWREIVERSWVNGTTVLRYPFTTDWADPEQTKPKIVIWGFKVHSRHGYRWNYPIHEVLEPEDPKEQRAILIKDELIRHYPDIERDRTENRLPIYEMWMDQYVENPRMVHYYASELARQKRYAEAEQWAHWFLALVPGYIDPPIEDTDQWSVLRAAVCRLIAACKGAQGRPADEVLIWMLRSLGEAPWQRETWIRMGQFWLAAKDWAAAEAALRRGHMITSTEGCIEIEMDCWDERAQEMLDLARKKLAKQVAKQAKEKK